MKHLSVIHATVFLLLFSACGVKKSLAKEGGAIPTGQTLKTEDTEAVQKLTFVQRVSDNAVYAKNISSSIDFRIQGDGKDISVAGRIYMRKDEVIRIQLTPLGLIEVGRIELTPDYVLIVDRIHKEYIKADYHQVDFLRDNGLSFYSLQALFWNQLFVPGAQTLSSELLKRYDVDLHTTGNYSPITLKNGDIAFRWDADKNNARIDAAAISYRHAQHGTAALDWTYTDFRPLGVKLFPAKQSIAFATSALKDSKQVRIDIDMGSLNTRDDWETHTQLSPKYKQISPEDVLQKILSL